MISQNIDGFEIVEKIGEGGMGAVYKAKQTSLDRIVALKILRPDIISDEEDITRFKNESLAAAKLNHNSIAQIYDAGQVDNHYYYAMAYVDGISVDRWIENAGAIPEADALIVAESVALALEHAWQTAGIVHHDIKPANLMIDADGAIKVVDLGLAAMVMEDSKAKDDELDFLGTPNFSSPEHLSGDETDWRSDMYSLGATLYNMVTATVPFAKMEGSQVMEQQINGFLVDPRDINSKISAGTARLIAKFMAKNPEDRFTDWKEAISDIKRVRKGSFPLHQIDSATGESTIKLRKPGRSASKVRIKKTTGNGKTSVRIRQDRQTKLKTPGQNAVKRKPKKRSDILAHLIAFGVACLFVVVLLLVMTIARSRSQREEAARASIVSVETLYSQAEAHRVNNPEDYAGSIARFQKVIDSYPESLLGQKASDQVHLLRRDSKRASDKILDALRKEAAELASEGRHKEAVALLSEYSGPLARETSTERERTAASYRPMTR